MVELVDYYEVFDGFKSELFCRVKCNYFYGYYCDVLYCRYMEKIWMLMDLIWIIWYEYLILYCIVDGNYINVY